MPKPTATINGLPFIAEAAIEWPLREGPTPVIQDLPMIPQDAEALVGRSNGPFTLEIRPTEGAPVIVKNLWVLKIMPGPDPYVSMVRIADRRWFWEYAHVLRRYNIRRAVGVKRLFELNSFVKIDDRAPEYAFWEWSLDEKGQRWSALSALQDTFKGVAAAEKEHRGKSFTLKVDDRIGKRIKNLPIEGIQIDEKGDEAARRIVSYLPEAGIYCDYNGDIVVYSKATGDEEQVISAILPELRGEGHAEIVDNQFIRPKKIRVLFTREFEVRHDFTEVTLAVGQTVTEDLGDTRVMENVLPLPDYTLRVNSRTVVQGTYITFDDAFRSWPEIYIDGRTRRIDHDLVQRAFIPHMDLWAPIQLAGARPQKGGALDNFIGRIAAIQNHYRTTFRINPKWMDHTLAWRAHRIATVDPQRGTRAPSRAYGDYCVLYSQRSLWRNVSQNSDLDYAINKSAFPDDGILDNDAEPSPADVQILDHDQGVFHVDYRARSPLSGDTQQVLPSKLVEQSIPSHNLRQNSRPVTFDSVVEGREPPKLSSRFKLATVLSMIPASPNNKQQLHAIEVKPSEVKDMLPQALRDGLNAAKGPVMEIRIGANVEMARIAWSDDPGQIAEIEKGFGIRDGDPNLKKLVINEGEQSNRKQGASLNSIAKAQAAIAYASMVDRYEGNLTGSMNGNVHLSGWIQEIRHRLDANGNTTTQIDLLDKITQYSMFSFLDANSRAAIMRLVQVER